MDPNTHVEGAMVGWHSLPTKIRSLVVRYAIDAVQQKPESHPLSALAVVCGEWQELVEAVNFASLKLVSADLSDFDTLVNGRRRAWLRYICLEIELPRCGPEKSCVPETLKNDIQFTTDIQSLFKLLARWPVEDCPWGLEFELCARLPSDTQRLAGALGVAEKGDSRYFGSAINLNIFKTQPLGLHGLPMVDVITKFAVLRRCWWNIEHYSIMTIVLSLPRITELRYEPLRRLNDSDQELLNIRYAYNISFWPKTLKRISLFQHLDRAYDDTEDKRGRKEGGGDGTGSNIGKDGSGESIVDEDKTRTCAAFAMARRSIELEELSVAFICDASVYFQRLSEVRPGSQLQLCPSLRRLSLTSSILRHNEPPARVNRLFLAAAKAAVHMPSLRAMEIFNWSRRCSGVFRYVVGAADATIEWKGSWDVPIADDVERAWREVARAHAGCKLVVKGVPIKHRRFFRFLKSDLATRTTSRPTRRHRRSAPRRL